jgi:glycosyltransferase involved in cell wall biosynthesis
MHPTGARRVLQVHNRYREPGGEDAIAAAEAALLRGAGHTVIEHHVANPEGVLRTAAQMAAAPWNVAAARAVRRHAVRARPDVAHVHNTWFALSPSVVAALRRSGVPVVVTLHNYRLVCLNALLLRDGRPCTDCVGRAPLPGVRHRCYRSSAGASAVAAATVQLHRVRGTWSTGVNRFIAPSRSLRDRLVAGGLPADRIVVRPHAVADVGPRKRPPSASPTVVYAGRISDEKGAAVLLDAWAKARPPGLELVIAGDGPRRRELERRGIDGVRFPGWLPPAELHALMRGARALAFPSVCFEVFPATIVEAMAAGLPVLASAHGAAAEIVGPAGHEWLVTPGDVGAWAERLAILSDGAAVDAAGARSRDTYTSCYSPADGLRTLERVYREAIEDAAGDRP